MDKLQEGDPIIVRTKDYWYVYHYTRYEIVLPTDVHVIAPNPEDSTANPTKRMITLTTCEPKYIHPHPTDGSAMVSWRTGPKCPTVCPKSWLLLIRPVQ